MAYLLMASSVSAYCLSDIGLVRHNNEDAWQALEEQRFFVVADGMGGHQAGEVASQFATEMLCAHVKEKYPLLMQDHLARAEGQIGEMIQEVNATIYRMSREHMSLKGMGTTLCCVFFHPQGLIYGHVGDSRIYRARKGELEQLTKDHSLVREWVDLGRLTEQQAHDSTYKHIITRAIGIDSHVTPELADTPIEADDLILICTDGLHDLITREEIQSIVVHTPPEKIAPSLVAKAKEKGGHDNITVIVLKVHDAPPLS